MHRHSAESCAQRLAGLEGPCDHMVTETQFDRPVHWPPETCPLCQPGGKAALFPTLRRECEWCKEQGRINAPCQRCHGNRWVADVTLEKLLKAVYETWEGGDQLALEVFEAFIYDITTIEIGRGKAVIAACRALEPETGEKDATS